MSRLQTVADYEREIAELDAMIERELALRGPDEADFASDLSVYSLTQRRDALLAEMRATGNTGMPGEEFDLIFNGGPVHQHRLAVEFMGKVLVKIQSLVTSILAGESPDSARHGPFKADIRQASELQFAGSFGGSFGMRIEAIQDQGELDGFAALGPTLQKVIDLLEARDDPDKVFENVSDLTLRATKDYEELIEELSSNKADMKLVWPNISGERRVALAATEATRVLKTLREVRVKSSGQYYWGTLDQASRRYGRFGFATDDGQFFDGIVEMELIDQLKFYYDSRCKAWIETKEVRNPRTGIIKKTHRLQQLQIAPADKDEQKKRA